MKTWKAVLSSFRVHMNYVWSEDEKTYTPSDYEVRAVFHIQGGPQNDRTVEVWMTASEARKHGEELLRCADEADQENTER